MARIPDHEIEWLKREVSLQRLVEASGIKLKKHGKDYLGLCPFHDDKGPSLVISPDKNLWHCLGACDEGGDVVQWVMKCQGVSFRHAVELLKGGDAVLSAPEMPVTDAHPPRQLLLRCSTRSRPCDDGAPAYRPSLNIKRNTTSSIPAL